MEHACEGAPEPEVFDHEVLRSVPVFLCAALVLIRLPLLAQDYKFTISTAQTWTDTGVDLHNGDTLAITASEGANGCDPAGVAGTGAASNLPVANGMPGALIARTQESGAPTLVGPSRSLPVARDGHLYLGVNSAGTAPCQGSFVVKVHVTPQGGTALRQRPQRLPPVRLSLRNPRRPRLRPGPKPPFKPQVQPLRTQPQIKMK